MNKYILAILISAFTLTFVVLGAVYYLITMADGQVAPPYGSRPAVQSQSFVQLSELAYEDGVVKSSNQERIKAGLPELSINVKLEASSLDKAEDMVAQGYWAHTSPSGEQFFDLINEQRYDFAFAGENLARDFGTPEGVVIGWMNSPKHRENMLNPAYKEMGISVMRGQYMGMDSYLVVAHYGVQH